MGSRPYIIDVHTHIFNEQVLKEYDAKSNGRIRKKITIHYSTTVEPPKYLLRHITDFAMDRKDMAVIGAYNIYHEPRDQYLKLSNHFGNGLIVGVKMYPGYQRFHPYDLVVHDMAKLCMAFKRPLMFHCGATSARGYPILEYAHPIHIDTLAVCFPELKIVIAHFGFPYFLETAMVMSKNPNVYADISGTIDRPKSPEHLNRLCARYRDDLNRVLDYYPDITCKIMFGTDYGGEHSNLNQVEPYIDLVESVFGPDDQEAVFHKTAEKLFF